MRLADVRTNRRSPPHLYETVQFESKLIGNPCYTIHKNHNKSAAKIVFSFDILLDFGTEKLLAGRLNRPSALTLVSP
jgi:hypothetical protein